MDSPDTVVLRCSFNLTKSAFNYVVWFRETYTDQLYVQTEHEFQTGPGYENIVVPQESIVALSENRSHHWSEATLTMHITHCLAGRYHCRITDRATRQSEYPIQLKFTGVSSYTSYNVVFERSLTPINFK